MRHTRSQTHKQRETLGERVKHILEDRIVACSHGVYETLDWTKEVAERVNPSLEYPRYYLAPHHGFAEGYLSNAQALGWAFVERFFRLHRVLPAFLTITAASHPHTIVDLGCGTATSSIELAQLLPNAQLTLVDLSPYQLAAAHRQAHNAGLAKRTTYLHACAEATGLPDASADLIMSTLLFHELPRPQARAVVAEAYRLLAPGGRFVEFDPIQRAVPWPWADRAVNALLAILIREVYWREYMSQPVWEVCRDAGFEHIERKLLVAFPWVYQVITATK
jgi:ubiquinone/menaquinone biosynthesis C-methylase UbiE